MATSADELRAFHEFVGQKIAEGGGAPPSPEECLALWLAQQGSADEPTATLEAIRQGLDDMYAGRTRPASDVVRDLCHKHNLRDPR